MQDLSLTNMWSSSLPDSGYKFVAVLVQNGRYFAASSTQVYELSAPGGGVVNSLEVGNDEDTPDSLATDGQSLFVGFSGRVSAVALDGPWAARWSTALPGSDDEEVCLLVSNGRLFAGSYGFAFELDPASGAVLHSLELPYALRDPLANYNTRLGCDGQTLFVGCHGYVYGVALVDWSQAKWEASVAGFTQVEVLASDGMLFAGTVAIVYQLDPATGAQMRTLALLDPDDAALLDRAVRMTTDGATLYCGAVGFAYGIDLRSDWSSWKWHVLLRTADDLNRYGVVNLLVEDGRLYAGCNGVVTEITTDSGSVIDSLVLTSSFQTPFPDYRTCLASTGNGVLVGVHGYAYRVLALVGSVLAAALNKDSALEVFGVGPGGAVQQCVQSSSGWSSWSPMVGGFSSGPAALRLTNGQLALFGRGLDNALWYTQQASTGWSSWASLGGSLTSDPDVMLNSQGQMLVLARTSASDVARVGQGRNGWSQWKSLGGSFHSGPSTVLDGNDVLHAYADGADNSLMQCTKAQGDTWSSWRSLQGVLIGGPVAVRLSNGNIAVFARGTSNDVWLRQRINGTWTAWESLQGNISSAPAALVDGNGRLVVFARGSDKALWYAQHTSSGWSTWTSLGGVLTSIPVAVLDSSNAINVFARGAAGDAVHIKQASSGWTAWASLGGTLMPV